MIFFKEGNTIILSVQFWKHKEYAESHWIWSHNWFKENENLGDIINQHRLNTTLIASLENTIKANKQRIVALDNDNEKLQELVLTLRKDLDLVAEEISNIKAIKGGKLL